MTSPNEKAPGKGGFEPDWLAAGITNIRPPYYGDSEGYKTLELMTKSLSVPDDATRYKSGVCAPSCACLALSSVDQRLLRWRKELFLELSQSGQAGTDTGLATLRRELRELHHLLLLSAQGELLRAAQLPYSDAGEQT